MSELPASTAIDAQVARLLNEAGALRRFPTPVDDLIAVQRLRLALPDESIFSPAVLAKAPPDLLAKIAPMRDKFLAMIDRRERAIHLAPGEISTRQRFHQCHELGHDLCPWHDEHYYIDGDHQLSPQVRALFEREANYAGASLLFQQDFFDEVARNYRVTFAEVKRLAQAFGASIEATLYRHIERNLAPAAVVVVGRGDDGPTVYGRGLPPRHIVASGRFGELFDVQGVTSCLSAPLQSDLQWAIDDLARTGRESEGYLTVAARDGTVYRLSFQLATNSYIRFLLLHSPIRHAA